MFFLVTVNHDSIVNILTPTLIYQNSMQRFSTDVQSWCQSKMNRGTEDLEHLREEFTHHYYARSSHMEDVNNGTRNLRQASDNIQVKYIC